MASLSHAASTAAPFPTPNDSHQQFSPSLLPMEPPLASPLHLPFNPSLCNVHEANILHAVPTCAAFYDHSLPGWIGGDDPLLNSSWEALDQILSDSSLSDLDHKPLGSLYSGTQRSPQFHDIGSAIAMMSNPNNVGLNLARLFSSDRGFAERAAKFSSYSQQAKPAATAGYAYNRSSIVSASHPATRNSVSISPTAAFKSENAAMEVQDCRQYSDHTSEKSKGSSPESSVVSNGSKKKRAGSEKEVLEMEEDSNTVNRGKRAKRSNYENVAANRMKLTNACMKNGTSQTARKNEQSTSSISTKSDQTREISKPVVRAADAAAPTKPDVVHVRARRGQATDSHSLAERVRREKISERMKYLQDLVPGCTKIINYVQALQHQVEFLSMKLAAVPPSKLEFNFQSLFGKEAMKHEFRQESNPNAAGFAHLDRSYLNTSTRTLPTQQTSSYPYHQLHHDHHTPLQSENAKNWPAVNPSCSSPEVNMLIAEGQCVSNEISDVWDNDLHNNMMQMGFAQTPTPGFQGALPQYCQPMKTEKTTQDMS